jgi:hypothetical protein
MKKGNVSLDTFPVFSGGGQMDKNIYENTVLSFIEYFNKNEGVEKIYIEVMSHKNTRALFKSKSLSSVNILDLLIKAEEREKDAKKSKTSVKFLEAKISILFNTNVSNSNWL